MPKTSDPIIGSIQCCGGQTHGEGRDGVVKAIASNNYTTAFDWFYKQIAALESIGIAQQEIRLPSGAYDPIKKADTDEVSPKWGHVRNQLAVLSHRRGESFVALKDAVSTYPSIQFSWYEGIGPDPWAIGLGADIGFASVSIDGGDSKGQWTNADRDSFNAILPCRFEGADDKITNGDRFIIAEHLLPGGQFHGRPPIGLATGDVWAFVTGKDVDELYERCCDLATAGFCLIIDGADRLTAKDITRVRSLYTTPPPTDANPYPNLKKAGVATVVPSTINPTWTSVVCVEQGDLLLKAPAYGNKFIGPEGNAHRFTYTETKYMTTPWGDGVVTYPTQTTHTFYEASYADSVLGGN